MVVKFSFWLNGYRMDPDRQALHVDPDPAKCCRSERIRISILQHCLKVETKTQRCGTVTIFYGSGSHF
jgi:hypothetical protein